MKNFTDIVNRLKTALSVSMDKDVAEYLNLTKSAFAERKRRGVFPEDALRLLELRHPELKLDVDYILTGNSDTASEKEILEKIRSNKVNMEDQAIKMGISITPDNADTAILLNIDEMKLLGFFRRSDNKGKQLILDTARMCKEYSLANLRLAEYTEKSY